MALRYCCSFAIETIVERLLSGETNSNENDDFSIIKKTPIDSTFLKRIYKVEVLEVIKQHYKNLDIQKVYNLFLSKSFVYFFLIWLHVIFYLIGKNYSPSDKYELYIFIIKIRLIDLNIKLDSINQIEMKNQIEIVLYQISLILLIHMFKMFKKKSKKPKNHRKWNENIMKLFLAVLILSYPCYCFINQALTIPSHSTLIRFMNVNFRSSTELITKIENIDKNCNKYRENN